MAKKFILYNGKQKIIFPINPESYEVVDSWDNQELNITQLGLITMIGKRGLKSITFSSFFPKNNYDFREKNGTVMNITGIADTNNAIKALKKGEYLPWTCIRLLQSWRGKILTFSISDTGGRVSWPCVIDGEFTYGERDHTGDVYFTITLKEYKRTNTKRTIKPPAKKAKAAKPTARTNVLFYETKKKDTLKIVSKKMTGTSSYASEIYNQNKATCKKAFKKYRKKLSKKQKKKYDKKSKYNKPMPKGYSFTFRNSDEKMVSDITKYGSKNQGSRVIFK